MSAADIGGLQTFPAELQAPDAWLEPFGWYGEMRDRAPVRSSFIYGVDAPPIRFERAG